MGNMIQGWAQGHLVTLLEINLRSNVDHAGEG